MMRSKIFKTLLLSMKKVIKNLEGSTNLASSVYLVQYICAYSYLSRHELSVPGAGLSPAGCSRELQSAPWLFSLGATSG